MTTFRGAVGQDLGCSVRLANLAYAFLATSCGLRVRRRKGPRLCELWTRPCLIATGGQRMHHRSPTLSAPRAYFSCCLRACPSGGRKAAYDAPAVLAGLRCRGSASQAAFWSTSSPASTDEVPRRERRPERQTATPKERPPRAESLETRAQAAAKARRGDRRAPGPREKLSSFLFGSRKKSPPPRRAEAEAPPAEQPPPPPTPAEHAAPKARRCTTRLPPGTTTRERRARRLGRVSDPKTSRPGPASSR